MVYPDDLFRNHIWPIFMKIGTLLNYSLPIFDVFNAGAATWNFVLNWKSWIRQDLSILKKFVWRQVNTYFLFYDQNVYVYVEHVNWGISCTSFLLVRTEFDGNIFVVIISCWESDVEWTRVDEVFHEIIFKQKKYKYVGLFVSYFCQMNQIVVFWYHRKKIEL